LKQVLVGIISKYDKAKPITGTVFGGWDDRCIAMTKRMGAKYTYVRSKAGFIRLAEAGRQGPPSIVCSTRRIAPGRFSHNWQAYAGLGDFYKKNDKGVLAFLGAVDPKDQTIVHDLQIFADDDAFKSHADAENIPEVANGFKNLFANYDMQGKKQPALWGTAWSNDDKGLAAKTSAMGAKFDVYGFDNCAGGLDLSC
jgi:hypothetical protein